MTQQQVLDSIRSEMEQLPGHLGFYYKNLVTGEEFGVRSEESFLAASVIKLPLFLHVLSLAAAGKVHMDEILVTEQEDKVPVCGALTLFSGPVEADIATLCRLMISISDNTATNRLIRHFGIEELTGSFRKMGL